MPHMETKGGYVYVLHNTEVPTQIKIGFTSKDPAFRAQQLSSGTGVVGKWEVAYYVIVPDMSLVEKRAHILLHNNRSTSNKELFRATLLEGIKKVNIAAFDIFPNETILPGLEKVIGGVNLQTTQLLPQQTTINNKTLPLSVQIEEQEETPTDKHKDITESLIRHLEESENTQKKTLASICLGKLKAKQAVPYLLKALGDTDPIKCGMAVEALGHIKQKSREMCDILLKTLENQNCVEQTLWSIGELECHDTSEFIKKIAQDEFAKNKELKKMGKWPSVCWFTWNTAIRSLHRLGKIDDQEVLELIKDVVEEFGLTTEDESLHHINLELSSIIELLAENANEYVFQLLLISALTSAQISSSPSFNLLVKVGEALGKIDSKRAIAAIDIFLKEEKQAPAIFMYILAGIGGESIKSLLEMPSENEFAPDSIWIQSASKQKKNEALEKYLLNILSQKNRANNQKKDHLSNVMAYALIALGACGGQEALRFLIQKLALEMKEGNNARFFYIKSVGATGLDAARIHLLSLLDANIHKTSLDSIFNILSLSEALYNLEHSELDKKLSEIPLENFKKGTEERFYIIKTLSLYGEKDYILPIILDTLMEENGRLETRDNLMCQSGEIKYRIMDVLKAFVKRGLTEEQKNQIATKLIEISKNEDADDSDREHLALEIMGKVGGLKIREYLEEKVKSEKHFWTKWIAMSSIAEICSPNSLPFLLDILNSCPNDNIKGLAIKTIRNLNLDNQIQTKTGALSFLQTDL